MTFDLYGPLPQGTTVLEASAGAGKTYAIVGLATRYVAEGVADLSQVMLVTFSRVATQELRERTRERLTSAARGLADLVAARRSDDPLIVHLARAGDAEVARRRGRLVRALADFDAATIATTHSFCQRMLDGLGIAGDQEPGVTLVETVDDLVTEVVDDLYLRAHAGYDTTAPAMNLAGAREAARAAIRDRQATLAPQDADAATAAGQRVAIATAARAEVERRKRRLGLRDFDDLLVLLRDTLADPVHGEAACRRVRDRYRVVLVDEFQDTDPVQWEVIRRAFHGPGTLILIGDPKQAVYAFRGAEVRSYLDAVRLAGRHQTLSTNWRSDAGLVAALDHLYGGAALGHPEIVVPEVEAAHPGPRLTGEVPLRLRQVDRAGSGPLGRSGYPAVGALRGRVADDLAADVVRLLNSGAALHLDGQVRRVEPGDIAVLVRTKAHIPFVRDALTRVGVPSVHAGSTSVFETPSATDWLWLLQAIEQPHRGGRVRLAALTPLVGWTAEQLEALGDDAVVEVGARLRDLAALFAEAGLSAVFERLSDQTRMEGRLLGVPSGQRRLTDLRHLAQTLNGAAVEGSLGLTALTAWLAERIQDPSSGSTRERSRRLESDAAAVQVVTVHSSKGLEFPVVYLPYAWDGAKNPNVTTLLLHGGDGQRILDIGGKGGPGYSERKRVSDTEDAGDELRLLYVALTRAMCQVVLWWAPGGVTSGSPLQRLLMGRGNGEAEPSLKVTVPEDGVATRRLAAWAAGAGQVISHEAAGGASSVQWRPSPEAAGALDAARFDRTLDMVWRRTSYSALTASVHDSPGVGSEAEQPERTDEPAEEPTHEQPLDGTPSPMNGLPAGAAFGTLVHEVLEAVDTSAADLPAELLSRCREAVAARLAQVDPAALATALLPVMATPLGFGTLADFAPGDRLTELDFELPLAGGDAPAETPVTLTQVAALLREHLPGDDPLAPYADLLDTVEGLPLRGYLSGSIDLVLRVPGPAYVVVDYKTNRLARGDLTTLHYRRDRMAAEMLRAHYPLQALLYSVALHRYLRWRQPGYDPARHLAGVQYLFIRGMVGPDTPPGCGVFDWKPPAALVTALSNLLAQT